MGAVEVQRSRTCVRPPLGSCLGCAGASRSPAYRGGFADWLGGGLVSETVVSVSSSSGLGPGGVGVPMSSGSSTLTV